MAIFSNTLDSLIERCFKLCLGTWYEGTCTGGTTGTVVDSSRYEADDYFQNIDAWARIRTTTDDAAPKGEERKISDWVQSGGTATVLPIFSAESGIGDTYAFTYEYRWDEVKEAINAAIDIVARAALVEKIDTSIQLQSSVYEYAIPSGFLYIYRISQATDEGDYPDPVPPDQYKIIRGTNPPRIHFYRFPIEMQTDRHSYGGLFGDDDITANRILRVEGLARQDTLTKDTDLCKIDPNFVCFQAAALLHSRRIKRADTDPDEHRVQADIWQGRANSLSGGAPLFMGLRPQILPIDWKKVEL